MTDAHRSDVQIVVQSCARRKPLLDIWWNCLKAHWPDCPYPVTVISPDGSDDLGWNANLIQRLYGLDTILVLLMLDDNWLEAPLDGETYTANINRLANLMLARPDIALVKVQAGGAAAPEIPFAPWDRLREYDRQPHPFKRTNLIPAMYRRSWLHRLSSAVLSRIGPHGDRGRQGAIEFEVLGTLLTQDSDLWPEHMLGIHRPGPDGSGGQPLLSCLSNDAYTGGTLRNLPAVRQLCQGIPGIEAFMSL